jgi:hypothetical protein
MSHNKKYEEFKKQFVVEYGFKMDNHNGKIQNPDICLQWLDMNHILCIIHHHKPMT